MKKITLLLLSLSACWLFFGCSSDNQTWGNSDASTGQNSDIGGGGPTKCASSEQCAGEEVCAPATQACTANLPCTGPTANECGKAAHCGASNTCVKSVTGTPCVSDDNCITGENCKSGFCGCDGQSFTATKVAPNVLIVLDRSTSMNDSIGGSSKWTIAKQAVANLLAARGAEIRFGLALFPGPQQICSGTCLAGAVNVAPAENNAATINAFLTNATVCDSTPIAQTLDGLKSYSGLKDTTRGNFIMLITDGMQTCNATPPTDPVPVVTALRNQTPSVKTFAVGFGSGVDPTSLDNIAQQGGTAVSGGAHKYYQADDAAALSAAFAAIAGSVLSCSYTLSSVPPDPSKLYVYQNKVEVARDSSKKNGWEYDVATNQITFYGAACTAMQTGQVKELSIVYGCPLQIE